MGYAKFKLAKIEKWEKKYLSKRILEVDWNVSELARQFAMDRGNLLRLLRKHSITRPADKIWSK